MLYIIIAVFVAALVGGGYYQGRVDGENKAVAEQSKEDKLVEKVRADAMAGAADAISKIEIKQTTIQGRLQKEIVNNVVYRDCVHSPDGLRNLNDALTNVDGPGSSGSGIVPSASAPAGRKFWFNK